MVNPYCDNNNVRTFSKEVDELDLIWHRDREDRRIVVESGNGWKLQKDNQPGELIKTIRSSCP